METAGCIKIAQYGLEHPTPFHFRIANLHKRYGTYFRRQAAGGIWEDMYLNGLKAPSDIMKFYYDPSSKAD